MKREVTSLEIRKGHSRLLLEKVVPGPLRAAVHGGVSFFYKITLDGSLRCMTPDRDEARACWRGCHRWLLTGRTSTAEVMP
jgi:hypothetical protein